jgi:hypothetical protein
VSQVAVPETTVGAGVGLLLRLALLPALIGLPVQLPVVAGLNQEPVPAKIVQLIPKLNPAIPNPAHLLFLFPPILQQLIEVNPQLCLGTAPMLIGAISPMMSALTLAG